MAASKRKKKGVPRRTLLKIRAVPLVRMPKSVFFDRIRSACRNGVVPDDISITTLNWDHAEGRRYMPGQRLDASDAQELENCYQLLTGMGKQSVRFERPA
jgi:hypothetical protein